MNDVYPGRTFRDLHEDYDAFFEYGIGAMRWRLDKAGRRKLIFIAPEIDPEPGRKPGICTEIYTMTDGEDWKVPGPVQGWDGNLERPTFNPSIWLLDRKGWHGFIKNGDLHTV